MHELTEKRTLRSKTFDLGCCRRMLRAGIKKPLHYHGTDGKLVDIDLSARLDRGQYFIDKAPYKVRIARDVPAYRYTSARGSVSASLVAINSNLIASRESELVQNAYVWRGISLDTDCGIYPRNAGIKALVTLHSANAPREWTWEVLGDRSMLRDISGHDAKGQVLELKQYWNGDLLTIKWTGRVYNRRLSRRKQPLTDPVYPITIDPSANEAIVAGGDDITSFTAGTYFIFNTASTSLYLGQYLSQSIRGGFRFQTVGVPQGATISSATLTLDILGITSTPSIKIYGADSDTLSAWANPGNLVKNITKTTANLTWSPTSTGTSALGVTSIVQEIVSRSGWSSSNNMGFGFFNNAGGSAVVAAYEHPTAQEAQLDIVYAIGGGGATIRGAPIFFQ